MEGTLQVPRQVAIAVDRVLVPVHRLRLASNRPPEEARAAQNRVFSLVEVRRMSKVSNGVVVHLGKGSMALLLLVGLVLRYLVAPATAARILEVVHEIVRALGAP